MTAVLDNTEAAIRDLRGQVAPGKRIAFVSGNFNIVHPGHLRLLKFAADSGDALVVGVNPDGTPGVTIPADMRIEGIRAISMVDHALLLEEPPHIFIAKLKPEIVVKGKEYEGDYNAEQAVVDSYGGRLLFSSGEVRFTSLNLLQQEYLETNLSNIQKPRDYPIRHGFKIDELKAEVGRLNGIRVLVIGDLIIDTYVDCEPLGMSREDPTVVVTPLDQKVFVGGAGIVAAHARGLGAEARLLTIGGRDEQVPFAQEQLFGLKVENEILIDETRPTTHKMRYRAQGKTLLRVNRLRQHAANQELVSKMIKRVEDLLDQTDLLLFSDFNYGCLPQVLVDAVTALASKRNVMLAADSQASSQVANIARFRGMILITPTEHEARLALQDFESGLVILGDRLKNAAQADNVLVTLNAEGLLVHAPEDGEYQTDRLPAFNTSPKDVAGAGDCMFTCTAMALRAGVDIWRSAYLGSLAAALQVSRVGNLPIDVKDLLAEIDHT
ncbi:MAG: adenylyltransferase/cytidyltransferase family protein [Alphaproteobacteria bacterium]|nr:adenylyltransferase/cytidyltransferase family protein [Alphaproteobacteria bacterium]